MKIFYAVQATGNGHISRATELIPYLQRYGTVDVFLSGDNSNLSFDLPIKYRSKGLSLYYNSTGGLDYCKMIRNFYPLRIYKEINDLPVEKYDLVINDFEFITAASCAKKRIPSIHAGHQASFQSLLTPRPKNRIATGEWILKNYARATDYVGLHFEQYDSYIFRPVIKKEILDADPVNKKHITIYLPSYSRCVLEKIFRPFKDIEFQVFSKETRQPLKKDNIIFLPVDKILFNQSLIECAGIITGAGFETPAEALYLGKKLLVIPTRGQYEQQCNAAALERMNIICVKRIDENFPAIFYQWLDTNNACRINYLQAIPQLLEYLFTVYERRRSSYSQNALEIEYDGSQAISY